MKNFIKEFSQGLYDALEKSDSPNCFSLEEIETFAWDLFRSFINKTAVLMGIFIVHAREIGFPVAGNGHHLLGGLAFIDQCRTEVL